MRPPLHSSGDTSRRRYVDAVGLWCAIGYAALALLARQPGEPGLSAFLAARRLDRPAGLRALRVPLPARRAGAESAASSSGPSFSGSAASRAAPSTRTISIATCGTPTASRPPARPTAPRRRRSSSTRTFPHAVSGRAGRDQLPGAAHHLRADVAVHLPARLLGAAGQRHGRCRRSSSPVDLVLLGLLLRLAPARNVLLYAWCPLVVKEIAFTAHPDGAGACLLIAAIVLARDRHWRSAAVLLGLATGAKVFGLVLAPLVLARARTSVTGSCLPRQSRRCTPRSPCRGARTWPRSRYSPASGSSTRPPSGWLATVMPRFGARLALGLGFALFWAY